MYVGVLRLDHQGKKLFGKNAVKDVGSLPESAPKKSAVDEEKIAYDNFSPSEMKAASVEVNEDFTKYMDNIE